MKCVSKDKSFSARKIIVQEASKNGIKPTAKKFGMSKNTVKLWLRRFQKEGNDGLFDQRRGPNNIPHKTADVVEKEIVSIRRQAHCFGAKRLKFFFDLKPSIGAIQRIIKINGLAKKVRRKHQKKE